MTDTAVFILILPVLLVCSAVASGAETALFRLTHRERAEMRQTAPAVANAVDALLAEPRRLLLLILIVNMVVNLAYFVVSSILTTRTPNPALGVAVGAGSVLAIVLIGEVLAKVLAGAGRRRFCAIFARPMVTVATLTGPLVAGVDRLALSPLVRLVRPPENASAAGVVRPDELRGLVEGSQRAGILEENERSILSEVIELGQLRVREAMLPRDRLLSIEPDAAPEEVIELAAKSRETTLLVCRDGLDGHPLGFLHIKRFLRARAQSEHAPLHESLSRPLIVPEQARLDLVLDRMRTVGVARALCVDERGTVVGLIRATDILDELLSGMGEQQSDEKHAIHLVGLNRWSVKASLSARDWAESFGIPEAEITESLSRSATIGGLVVEQLGRLAKEGDTVVIGGASLRVTRTVGRRIDELETHFDHASLPSDAEGGTP